MNPIIKKILGYVLIIISSISIFQAGLGHKMIPYNCDEPTVYPIFAILITMLIGISTLILGLMCLRNKWKLTNKLVIGLIFIIISLINFFLSGCSYAISLYTCGSLPIFPGFIITMPIAILMLIIGLILIQKK